MISCPQCPRTFTNDLQLAKHIKFRHTSPKVLPQIENESIIISNEALEGLPEEVHRQYKNNWYRVRGFHHRGRVEDVINFRVSDLTGIDLILDQIFRSQTRKFKLNFAFGFLLQNRITGKYQYYYPSRNTTFIKEPFLIESQEDLVRVKEYVEENDPIEFSRRLRPNSEWVFFKLVNLTAYVSKLLNHPIGNEINLPHYINQNHAIIALASDYRPRPYLDQKCFFRCLALHQGANIRNLEVPTNQLLGQFTNEPLNFRGVDLEDLRELEEIYNVNIHVYSLNYSNELGDDNDIEEYLIREAEREGQDDDTVAATLVRRPLGDKATNMYLHLYEGHFSYIKDIKMLTKSWRCAKCDKLFNHLGHYNLHEKTCERKIKHKFPGGGIGNQSHKTLFTKIEDLGIQIPENLTYYPYKITYDFETLFAPCPKEDAPKLTYENILVPASVSVCSDVPGFTEPKCFISEGNPKEMIVNMLDYMIEIANAGYRTLNEVYSTYLDALEAIDDKEVKTIWKMLTKWLKQIPVCGFNSGKFDFNIMKCYLIPHCLQNDIEITNAIKKESGYMQVATKQLVFLDVCNFISAGTSYSKWLKSWEVQENKGFWPYERFTSLEFLDQTFLPPREDFHNNLKDEDISEENYQYLQKVWVEKEMKSLRDLLIWYNNLDTQPMVEGLTKMCKLWQEMGIDMLKGGCISLPGLAYTHLVQTLPKRVSLPLWNKATKHWHYTLRDNICGGPSIIFKRYAEKGITKIRNGEKFVQKIFGMDANALYLSCIMENMPTGAMAEWKKGEDGLFRRRVATNLKELYWVEWMSHTLGAEVRHTHNGGQQKVGKYYVDGYIPSKKLVLQFHGCHFHGHGCSIDKKNDRERRIKTEEITKAIKAMGYTVIEKWECEFNKDRRENKLLDTFIKENCELPWKTGTHTVEKMLDFVKNDRLFGLVECSIKVPESLKEKFIEMTPIFKNIEVGREHISDYMKNIAETQGFLPRPRRCLIGSYFGDKILLATPLLKWYLEQGLVVTEIFQAIEFKPKKCFTELGKEVTFHRSNADSNPNLAMKGELFKLLGNSYYGKTITDVEKHTTLSFEREIGACRKINDWKFRTLEEIERGFTKFRVLKLRLSLNFPSLSGFSSISMLS